MFGDLHRAVVTMDLIGGDVHHASCGTRDEHLVAHLEGIGLDGEFRHTQFREVFHALADVDLPFGGVGTVVLVPFAHELSLVVAVPEPAVEDGGESLVPLVLLLFRERVIEYGLDGLLITFYHRINVFRSSCTAFGLEYAYATLHHPIDETYGFQVLGRHDVFIVDVELVARLIIRCGIAASAHLNALPAVGRAVGGMQAHIALAADGHAEGAVAEHLDADLLP